ncbi:MAG: formylglycine-generating enzyme family protein [Planctomycetota bacterium]
MRRAMPAVTVLAVELVLFGGGSSAMAFAYGDWNTNGVIDLDDYAQFPACLTGPSGGLGPGCGVFDFNDDDDVDLADFAAFQRAFGDVVIDLVPVGNPYNADDTHGDGYGGVAYTYNIGKYEVTAGQYCEFLNAVADTDTYGLYNTSMWSGPGGCKIQQTGSSGSYSYSVAPDWADRPVNYVSWGDAARFANWLHNGQPTGAQDLTTTEDGSYFLDGAMSNAELLAITREWDAAWVIPSEDEWYKAAYHKNDGVTGNYWDYPTKSDTVPTSEAPPGTDLTNGSASYHDGGYAIGLPYYRTEVGAYDAKPSDSPYGTFDQGGNVWEWNEAILFYGSCRGVRGGSFYLYDFTLHAATRYYAYPADDYFQHGFRVVEGPVP